MGFNLYLEMTMLTLTEMVLIQEAMARGTVREAQQAVEYAGYQWTEAHLRYAYSVMEVPPCDTGS